MPRLCFTPRATRRASVLVLVLWLIMVLFVIAISLSYEMRIGMKMASYGKRRVQAAALARAGMAKGVLDLKNDRLMSVADPTYNNDTPLDLWRQTEDKTDIELGGGTYTVRVDDVDSKLDLALINMRSQTALAYLLERVCNVEEDEALELAQAYVDYVDPDGASSVNLNELEIEYYTDWALDRYDDLLPEGYVFRPKNDALLSVEELMDIPGFTETMIFGDPEQTPRDPIVRADWEEPSTGLIDYLCVGTRGRININTCSRPVLEAMLFAATGGNGDIEEMAETILKQRDDLLEASDAGNRGFMAPEQLKEAGVPDELFTLWTALFPLAADSYYFTIVSRGRFEGAQNTIGMRVHVDVAQYQLDFEDDSGLGLGLRDDKAFGYLKSKDGFKIDPEVRVDRTWEY